MAGVYLNPLEFPDDWNTVILAGMSTPGKCKVGKWERKVEYDKKTGKAVKGAQQTLKGLPPAEGEIEFWAWTPEHFAAWTTILPLLKFDPTKLGSTTPAATTNKATGTGTTAPGGSVTTPSGQVIPVTAATAPALLAAKQSGDFSAVEAAAGGGNSSFTGNTPNAAAANAGPPALSAAFAIDIFHPAIADLEVSSVLPPTSLGSWEEDGEASGMYKRTIKFEEFTGTPPNASIAATPSGAATSNTPQPGANPAGTNEGPAAPNAASSATAVGAGAQGAWGAP